jgi:hypothetical protein
LERPDKEGGKKNWAKENNNNEKLCPMATARGNDRTAKKLKGHWLQDSESC